MRYMLLICTEESYYATMDEAAMGQLMARYEQFDKDLKAAGVEQSGVRLQPTPTATCVRVRNGDRSTTDGPFAETKEALGGFYIIDVPDLDAALDWAAKIPSAEYGTVEVRPVWEEEDY